MSSAPTCWETKKNVPPLKRFCFISSVSEGNHTFDFSISIGQ